MIKIDNKKIVLPIILVLLMMLLTWNIGANTLRTDFTFFIAQYLALFTAFYIFWLNKWGLKFWHFFAVAILLRVILLFAVPELSNDFYRFIWDGELIADGYNPFQGKPADMLHHYFTHKELFSPNEIYQTYYDDSYRRMLFVGMQQLSQDHYTCYPVVNQFLFFVPAALSDCIAGNVIGLKIIVILADIGAIIFAKKIAEHLKIAVHNIWLYALNPFIILEFSGNLHFEGVMIFFLLGAIYFTLKNNWLWAGVLLGLAVQVKLIPLMLIPFFYKKLKWQNAIGFTALTALVVLGVGGLMLNSVYLANMMESVNEYFIRFQFNGSIAYVVSAIGFEVIGWDPIMITGPVLSMISTIGILLLAILKAHRKDLDMITGMLFAFMIYYSLTATVHPWYISLLLVLSIFTKYKFGLVWSIVIMLSYYAYSTPGFKENMILNTAQYILVYGVLLYEIYKYWDKKAVGIQLKEFFSSPNK
ncbi:MAG: alpha-1,6-mannosyltransferase [Crocinitomix sp.]|jgi:alpha-1,6-mannosyltransferase